MSTSGATNAAVRFDAPPRVGADPRGEAVVAQLCALPTVADARVAFDGDEACVLLVPSEGGRSRLRAYGWLTFAEDLELAIAPTRVRAWRFVENVDGDPAPRVHAVAADCANGEGVADAAIVARVLAPLPTKPVVLDTRRESPDAVTLNLRVPLDVAVCREHFPRAPIVPGVVQLGWAEEFARALLPVSGRFVALEVVKFHHVVQPGDVLELRLEWLAPESPGTHGRLKMAGATQHGRVLSGRMVFAAA